VFERLIGIGDLVIESAGEHGQSTFSDIRDPEAVQLQIYRQMDANGRRRSGYASAAPERPPGVLSDLERLADLRDRGAVTEEEFQAKKRELLDRL
jgi:Short C-terminal domain